jgi:hypothetical protein
MRYKIADAKTKKIIDFLLDDDKDLILMTVLKLIANNPELKYRFWREFQFRGNN